MVNITKHHFFEFILGFAVLLLRQLCPKLFSVNLFHLHLCHHFWTWLCIQLVRVILNRNNWPLVPEHLHRLVWIHSQTFNRDQHLVSNLKHPSGRCMLIIMMKDLNDKLVAVFKCALPEHNLIIIFGPARKKCDWSLHSPSNLYTPYLKACYTEGSLRPQLDRL
jgi:hypothetical protein